MKKNTKHIIAYFFLIAFSLIQVLDLHALSHDANDVDCKICQLASENLDDNFVPTHSIKTPKEVIVPVDRIQFGYTNTYFGINTYYSFLNKAPPVA